MTNDQTKRAYGWTDFAKQPPPVGRVIMCRLKIVAAERPVFQGTWFLPQVVAQVEQDKWFRATTLGYHWRFVLDTYFTPENRWQWRDIPGLPMRQAIHMAKMAMES